MKRYWLIALVSCSVLLSGCSTVDSILSSSDDSEFDNQPWNQPASWENEGLGIQY